MQARGLLRPPGGATAHPPVLGPLALGPTVVGLAIGVGCRRGCPPEALRLLVADCLDAVAPAGLPLLVVASLDRKADEAAVTALAEQLGLPLKLFDAAALEACGPSLASPSQRVRRAVACPGVAEAAALAAAGPGAVLLLAKRSTSLATCAVAGCLAEAGQLEEDCP